MRTSASLYLNSGFDMFFKIKNTICENTEETGSISIWSQDQPQSNEIEQQVLFFFTSCVWPRL